MGKKLTKITTESPLDQLSDLIETKIETKKEKTKEEIFIPLTKEQKKDVADLISKHNAKEKAVTEYENKLLEIKENIANPFYIKECFSEKKNIGSLFLDANIEKRAQFIPMDSWSEISVSKTDTVTDKLGRIKKIVGDEIYPKFIAETTDIRIKTEIIEDKEKLVKFIQLIQANPEYKPYFEVIKGYKVQKGALDLSFQLSQSQRENLIAEVPVKSASLKVVKNPDFITK